MSLTSRQTNEQARAELEALIADLMSARRDDDATATGAARAALIEFNTPFQDLNAEAEDAAAAAILENVNEALDKLAQIASRLGPFGDIFAAAREVAREEKKELLIPRLAASAAQTLELFTILHQAAETISEQLDSAGEANDLDSVASILSNLLDELNKLRDAARAASAS